MKTLDREQGMTLIELLIAITVGVIVVGGASAAFTSALNGASGTQDQLAGSHDMQLIETYLPPDIQSGQSFDTASIPSATFPCTGAPGASLSQPSKIQMSWVETLATGTTTYHVRYQIVSVAAGEWNLVRYACDSSELNVKSLVVAHEILEPTDPDWSGIGGASISCGRVSLTLIDVTGYSYTVGGNIRTPVTPTTICPGVVTTTTSSTTTTTLVSPDPELLEVAMFDTNANGKIDRLVATFSKDLTGCTLVTEWSLTNAPSGASVVALVSSTGDAERTLTLTEGVGAADTSVDKGNSDAGDDFNVSFSPLGACNAVAASSVTPLDGAGPALIGVTGTNAGAARRFGTGDTITFTFSENVQGYVTPTTMTLIDPPGSGNAALTFNGITPTLSIPNAFLANNRTVTFAITATSPPTTTKSLTMTLGSCSGNCGSLQTGSPTTSISWSPATTITDLQDNAAASTAVSTVPVVF
jgi:prepilin-type N-terminal cleavage/methylation domain-containing protein